MSKLHQNFGQFKRMEDHGAPESDSQVDWQVGRELELVHSETRQE